MNDVERQEKIDNYFQMMHPNFSSYSNEEEQKALADEDFIKKNTEIVDVQYAEVMRKNGNDKKPDSEIMKYVMWYAKVEKYFALLHPDISKYPTKEKMEAFTDKDFLIENTDMVHYLFEKYSRSGGLADKSDKDRVEEAMWHAKVEKYFEMLHPDYEKYSEEQKKIADADKVFLIENTNAVHYLFSTDFSDPWSKRYMREATDQEKIAAAMTEVREQVKEKGKKTIKPKEVLEYALGHGVTKEDTDRAKAQERSTQVTKENEGEITNE